jgi:hypothetical protein
MELYLDEFDINNLTFGKNVCILGEKKREFIKYILQEIIPERTYGTVITTNKNNYTDYFPSENIYKRYSVLLKERIFIQNSFLIIDDYVCNKIQIDDIKDGISKNNMFFIHTIYSPDIVFDYIIITSNEIKYNGVNQEYIEICTEQGDYFVIKPSTNEFFYC